MRELIGLIAGLVFGLGLMLSGMTNPMKVKGFLDLAGSWDPSLAFVMVGAIAVGSVAFAIARKKTLSWIGDAIEIPRNRLIDWRLILGGVLFGTGWGLAGLCPGPALVNLGDGNATALLFVPTMLIGMVFHDRFIVERLRSSR